MLTLVLLACVLTFHLPGGDAECRDLNRYCADWARKGECQKNPTFMNVNCKKSCGLCGGGCSGCKDYSRYCSDWTSKGECQKNPGYMKINCRYSCAFCHCGTKPPPPPPTRQPGTTDYPSPPIPRTDIPPPPPIPTKELPSPPLPGISTAPPTGTDLPTPPVPVTKKQITTELPRPPLPPTPTKTLPTALPTTQPTTLPTTQPTTQTTTQPKTLPTTQATTLPTTLPTTRSPIPTLPASVCNNTLPVGIALETFPSAAFKASTSESRWHQPDQARLNCKPSEESVGAWCAGLQDNDQWIRVDIGYVKNITAVLTQGRESEIPKYVMSYFIDYSIDGKTWKVISDEQNPGKGIEFGGNSDISTVKESKLRRFVEARHIRIRPSTWKNMICMRLEFSYCADGEKIF